MATEQTTPAASDTRTARLFDCAKCDGTGRIGAFSHISAGVCFACGGSKKVTLLISDADELATTVSNLFATADAVLMGAKRGDMDYATAYLGHMVDDMFKVGTANAREVLNHLGAGKFWDAQGHAFGTVAGPVAAGLRAQLVTMEARALVF